MIGTNSTNLSIIISAIDNASATFAKVGMKLAGTGAKMQKAGKSMTRGLTLPILAMGAASVKFAATFDQAMTKSLAIMKVTIEQEEQMKEVARDVAKSTSFSHREAADAYYFLASAGLSANEAMASMPKVAEFAQAGAFDLAKATDLLTDAQSALGLVIKNDAVANMKNMVKVSDVLVKANTLANASVEQFSEALTSEAGAALKSFNIDIEEGTAVLAAFADQGIKGQVAGTGLSRILRLLTQSANNNKKEMRELGISVYDSEGNMRNLADILENLEVSLDGMSDAERTAALESIGFSARIQGVILPLLGTSQKVREYEAELRKAGGTTKEVSDKQLQSFINQMKMVKDRLIDVGIAIGDILMPYVLTLSQKIADLTEKFEGFSESTQKIIIVTALFVAVLGPLLLVMGTLAVWLPRIATGFLAIKGLIIALANPIRTLIWLFGKLKIVFLFLMANPLVLALATILGLMALLISRIVRFGKEFGGVSNAIALHTLYIKELFLRLVIFILEKFNILASKIPWLGGVVETTLTKLKRSLAETSAEFNALAIEGAKAAETEKEVADATAELDEAQRQLAEDLEALKSELPDIGEGFEEIGDEAEEAFQRAIDGIKEIREEIKEAYEEMAKGAEDYHDSMESEEKSFQDKVVDLVTDTEEKIAKLNEKKEEAEKDRNKDSLNRMTDLEEAKAKIIEDSNKDALARLEEFNEDKNRAIEDEERAEQKRAERLDEEKEKAAIDNDGEELMRLIEASRKKEKEEREDLAERLRRLTESYQKRVKVAKVNDQEDLDRLLKLNSEKESEEQSRLSEELNGLNKTIGEKEAILQDYYDTGLGFEEELEERRKYLAMNEMERLIFNHNKKLLLLKAEYLTEQVERLKKLIALQEEHNVAMDIIEEEKQSSVDAEIEKTRTFREGLADRTRAFSSWIEEQKILYRGYTNIFGGGLGSFGMSAPISIRGSRESGGGIYETGAYLLHKGETVIPSGGRERGGDVNVYIQGGNYLDRYAGEKFAEILGKMLKKQLRYQQGY